MNPYNDVTFYDYLPMPYNGFYPRPEYEGGTHGEDGANRRKKNQNMAAIFAALEYYDDS